jgi:hypothetical protein
MIFLNVFFFRFHIFLCFPYVNLFFLLGLSPKLDLKKKTKLKIVCLVKLQIFINFTHFFLFFKFDLYYFDCYLFCLRSLFRLFIYIYSLILKITWVFSSLFICCSLLDLLSLINIKLVENWASWFSLDLGFKGLRV